MNLVGQASGDANNDRHPMPAVINTTSTSDCGLHLNRTLTRTIRCRYHIVIGLVAGLPDAISVLRQVRDGVNYARGTGRDRDSP